METSKSGLLLISERIKNYRINCQMTQKQLAEQSGVSLRCIQRFEKGEDIQFSNLFKILNALNLGSNIEMLVPDATRRPSAYVSNVKVRKRVRTSNKSNNSTFKWGDEQK